MKLYFDKYRKDLHFRPNTYVMLDTSNLNLPAFTTKKLKPMLVGPFKVIKCVGTTSYRLELPSNLKIHPVFHISILKEYRGTPLATP